jgi:hypothetical protein
MKLLRSVLPLVIVLAAGMLPLASNREVGLLTQQSAEPVYFKFDCPPNPQTFIIQLSNPVMIDEARAMLAGQQPAKHLIGQIVKQPAAYNPPWSYHLEPASIQFFNVTIEVCDATILAVEEHLDEACGSFLPGCTWCPWSSRLIEEVPLEEVLSPRLFLPLVFR